ncbi:transglutaminase domain-containing protein [Candidatus Woesearchaeota archaeon]|nr:MAG: transglutaminase domain-containing protein [Candidatus Woesearchaeota archaeon]
MKRENEGLKPEDIMLEAERISKELETEAKSEKQRKYLLAILAVILGALVVLMIIPAYSVKLDPQPEMKAISELIVRTQAEIQEKALQNSNFSQIHDQEKSIAYLASRVSAYTKRTADSIVSAACRKSAGGKENRVCHAKAIYYFVRDGMQYVGDPPDEYYKSPEESMMTLTGDCDDHSILLSSLLRAVGIRTRLVAIPNHVYVEAYIPEALERYKTEDGWVSMDATCKNCGFGEIGGAAAAAGKNKRYIYI